MNVASVLVWRVCVRVRNFSWESIVNSKRREKDYFHFHNMNKERKSYVISFRGSSSTRRRRSFLKRRISFSIFRERLRQHAQYSRKQINSQKITVWDCAVMIAPHTQLGLENIYHRNSFLSVVRNNVGQTGNVNIATVEGNEIVQRGTSGFTRGDWLKKSFTFEAWGSKLIALMRKELSKTVMPANINWYSSKYHAQPGSPTDVPPSSKTIIIKG